MFGRVEDVANTLRVGGEDCLRAGGEVDPGVCKLVVMMRIVSGCTFALPSLTQR